MSANEEVSGKKWLLGVLASVVAALIIWGFTSSGLILDRPQPAVKVLSSNCENVHNSFHALLDRNTVELEVEVINEGKLAASNCRIAERGFSADDRPMISKPFGLAANERRIIKMQTHTLSTEACQYKLVVEYDGGQSAEYQAECWVNEDTPDPPPQSAIKRSG